MISVKELAKTAWAARESAYSRGGTKVGCAVITAEGLIFSGCNVEHRFRSHDVHAEVNAITSMVSAGSRVLSAVVIAAEREFFTPCGACMDWIMEFGSRETVVAFQGRPDGDIMEYTAGELMPHYPR